MIDIRSVTKAYAGQVAVDDVSFAAPDGFVTGLVGPNGAGKSTLLRVITGLTVPDAGSVTVDGGSFAAAPRPGALLGAFLSAEWIPERVTVSGYLTYVCDVQGVPRHRVDEVLEFVDLPDSRGRRIATLSLGMRQRLGIAAVLIGRPRNLVLDEPVNGLDPDGLRWFRDLVRSTAAAGGSVLLSSHHINDLALIADHVVMLNRGTVVRSGPVAEFVAQGGPRTYFETGDLDGALSLLRSRGFVCETHGAGAIVDDAEPDAVGWVLFADGGPGASELRSHRRSLEETYFDEVLPRSRSGGQDEHG